MSKTKESCQRLKRAEEILAIDEFVRRNGVSQWGVIQALEEIEISEPRKTFCRSRRSIARSA